MDKIKSKMQFFTIQINKNKSTLHYCFQGASASEDHLLLGSPKRRMLSRTHHVLVLGCNTSLQPGSSVSSRLPAHVPRRAAAWAPHPCQAPDGFQAPASAWPRSGCYCHLGTEPVDRFVSHLPFNRQISLRKKKNSVTTLDFSVSCSIHKLITCIYS